MPLGLPSSRSKTKRWLSRSAPTTPSGSIPMSFLPGQRPSETDNNNQQAVPLLAEQDENENNNVEQAQASVPLLAEQEEDRHEAT